MTTESRTSEDSKRLDPFDFWRQVYEANEQAWTKAMKEVTTSQGYAEAQGKMLETLLVFQKMMRDVMSAQLSSLNIPTRDDVARLGELILSLEEKVDQLDERLARVISIEEKVGHLDERLAGLTDINKKVEQLDGRLARIDERLARQSQRGEQGSQPQAGSDVAAKGTRARAGRTRSASQTPGGSSAEKSQ